MSVLRTSPVSFCLFRSARCRQSSLIDERRLQLHLRRSTPLLNELHGWLTEQLEQRNTEPNSSLG